MTRPSCTSPHKALSCCNQGAWGHSPCCQLGTQPAAGTGRGVIVCMADAFGGPVGDCHLGSKG